MNADCRVMFDGPQTGVWNMAVDEALLQIGEAEPRMTLRFYQWREPTLSLGYFQSYESRADHPPSRGCPCVRRVTGGGAIVHDRELTYSLIVPLRDRRLNTTYLYAVVHDGLVEALKAQGISLERSAPRAAPHPAFLCFQRRSAHDLVLGAHKVLGSAQRRRGPVLLQHGSLLVSRSPAAPELPGVLDLRPDTPLALPDLAEQWARCICQQLAVALESGSLLPTELAAAHGLARDRFENPLWTQRR